MTGNPITPLVNLCLELRGDVPRPVLETLIVEALEASADLVLCEAWAVDRQRLFPQAIKCAHSRHAGRSYTERHRGYLETS
jgi:hypothetical protein